MVSITTCLLPLAHTKLPSGKIIHISITNVHTIDITGISDPWWIFTIGSLFWNIKFQYELKISEILQVIPLSYT